MQAVAITGPRKSGKTTVLSLVAEVLERQGKTVAAVKYSSHPLEQENTDAFWLRRPNRPVVNVAPGETVVFWPETLSFEAIAAQLRADVLLLEGGDAPLSVPRILCLPEDAEDAGECVPEKGAVILATVGGAAPELTAPHFTEIDPVAAETLAALILRQGGAL